MVNNVSLSFGGRTLFDGVNFQVNDRDRVGLVGPNGTGKTTLLKLIMGQMKPDSGETRRLRGLRLGYLPQEALDVPDRKIMDWMIDAVPGAALLKSQIDELERDLETTADLDQQAEIGERLSHLHTELDHLDALFSRHEAERILFGLGFHENDLSRSMSELSGGWRMRAALARLLFEQTDVLLLDEPTNHLDVPSVHWLDEYLGSFNQALVLICHDREFLNKHIRRVVSLEEEGVKAYTGNYDQYLKMREQEEKITEAQSKKQERKVKEAQRFIDRFRAKSSKARQAQSKIKLLDKMELIQTFKKRKQIHFTFPHVEQSGRDVLALSRISKSFKSLKLYDDVTLRVQRGDRVAIIGPNGAGKTTLLRIMANELAPDSGKVVYGHNSCFSYYAQHHTEQLNPNATVLEEVNRAVPDAGVGYIRDVCGAFLFSGDDVDKAVGVLSGGEKARVALARLLVAPGNLMMMDEPTNHLDLFSSEILIDALSKYGGTLVFVSHNQSFVNQLASKIWNIENGKIEEFPGNLEDYFYHREQLEQAGMGNSSGRSAGALESERAGEKPHRKDREARKEQRRIEAQKRQRISREVEPLKKELADLEDSIGKLEKRESEVSKQLADPEIYQIPEKTHPLLDEYDQVRGELDRLMKRWEECQLRFEEVMTRLNEDAAP